jgi:septal ring factor EnvC (AmiA/AmiB activator)
MPRQLRAIGFTLVLLLGVYGCAKGPGSASMTDHEGNGAKVKKLEDDYRAATAARDQFRQKLAYAEEQQVRTQKELERTRTAADALKGEVKARTAERDALQVQYETFRKNLKDLLGTADAAVGALNLPAPKPPADQGARK